MNHTRRFAFLPLAALAALGALLLPARPACAQAPPYGLFTIANVVSAAPGGSGSFDVILTAEGGDLSVGGFNIEPFLPSAAGVSPPASNEDVMFTAAGFNTSTPYIFPDSLDQDSGFTLSSDSFPNTDFRATDSDAQNGSAVTLTDGQMVGLAHVTYQFGAADTPGSTYTVDFNTDALATSISDGAGNTLPSTTAPGALSVAPEPSEWAALGFTGVFAAGLMLRARRRRPAEAE